MKLPNLLAIFFIISLPLFSQNADTAKHYYIGLQAHYGFIIPHSPAIEPVSHTNPYGFEISFDKLNTSFESWSVFHLYNNSGIQAGYFNFQNPNIVGSAYNLTVFTEPVIYGGRRFLFSLKAGGGLSYQTKVYEPETNPLNKFFSMHFAFPLYLVARVKYRISEKTFVTLSGSYNHISNGSMRVPNYGINYPTVSLGLESFRKKFPELEKKFIVDRHIKKSGHYFLIQVLAGYKEAFAKPTFAFGLNTRFVKQLRPKYCLNAGAELIMDGGIKEIIRIKELDVDYKRFAITAGQDFLLGRVVFTQYLGIYLYDPYRGRNPVYQKYELTYAFLPDLFMGFYLKAHTSNAELFGICLNYRLLKKVN
jgi:hypothetical protein